MEKDKTGREKMGEDLKEYNGEAESGERKPDGENTLVCSGPGM